MTNDHSDKIRQLYEEHFYENFHKALDNLLSSDPYKYLDLMYNVITGPERGRAALGLEVAKYDEGKYDESTYG